MAGDIHIHLGGILDKMGPEIQPNAAAGIYVHLSHIGSGKLS